MVKEASKEKKRGEYGRRSARTGPGFVSATAADHRGKIYRHSQNVIDLDTHDKAVTRPVN